MGSKKTKPKKKRGAGRPKKRLSVTPNLKKQRFIETWIATDGNVSKACKAIDISSSTFYAWLKKDPVFVEKLMDAEQGINDFVRSKLLQRINDGNVQSIIFYLKNKHPDFQQKQSINVNKADFKVSFILDEDTKKNAIEGELVE